MSIIPTLVITPMVFLGGSLYSLDMLPEFWQMITYFNPVVYLINGLRYSLQKQKRSYGEEPKQFAQSSVDILYA